MTTKEKIEKIENKIKRHEYNFFVLGETTITKEEMEILKVELHDLKNIKIDPLPVPNPNPDAKVDENLFEFYDDI